jgi:hypothetical protein
MSHLSRKRASELLFWLHDKLFTEGDVDFRETSDDAYRVQIDRPGRKPIRLLVMGEGLLKFPKPKLSVVRGEKK